MGVLDGKTALVTGAAGGIGLATCRALMNAGAKVAGLDIASIDGGTIAFVAADVTSEQEVVAAVRSAAAQLGGVIDILVNCAGIERVAPLPQIDLEDLDRMYAVNVRGTVLVSREALPYIPEGGRIINVASELAYLGRAGSSGYAATKGAILSLTRSWARELAPRILVNAIAPGPTDTPLLGFERLSPASRVLELSNPLGRIGRPEEIAPAIVFLSSSDASFITGQCFGIDGGAAMR